MATTKKKQVPFVRIVGLDYVGPSLVREFYEGEQKFLV